MSVFIPKKIKVGFQHRNNTYTNKLGFVIYYDEKGTLRKENSWSGWIDKTIPSEEFENTPTEGFVLDEKVGGYSTGWNHRDTYVRVYDPRGFEIEIKVPNLLWILEWCSCIRGKGIEGKLIYGWSGTELMLIPIESDTYQESIKLCDSLYKQKYISKEDLKIGATYLSKDGHNYVYMGRYDVYATCYFKDGKKFITETRFNNYCRKTGKPVEKKYRLTRWYVLKYTPDEVRTDIIGKKHVFGYSTTDETGCVSYGIQIYESIKGNFIDIVSDIVSCDFSAILNEMTYNVHFYPMDESHYDIIDAKFENIERILRYCGEELIVCKNENGELINYIVKTTWDSDQRNYVHVLLDTQYQDVLDIFPTEEVKRDIWSTEKVKRMIPVTLKEIYGKLHIVCRQRYLTSGVKYEKEYSWNVNDK